ncbi:MAG: nucleoside-triphosphatase [Bacteroidota bacterium]
MQYFPKKQLSEKWLKAAVVGSLWATVEIVLGSLLHNLKLPFAGSVLSFITVYLVMAFFRVWPVHGLIWRAGLICALMKSISPSAMILGPMIGIFSQAVILDFTIRTLGKNNFGYMVGGALAVFSALVQKAVTLLILYGWDLVVLLENMYAFAIRQTGMGEIHPGYLLLLLSIVYLSSGAMAALMGNQAGVNFLKNSSNKHFGQHLEKVAQSDLFKYTRKKNHSVVWLVAAFILLTGGMITISQATTWVAATLVLVVVGAAYLRYPGSMRFIKKPALWIQLLIIVALTAAFKNGLEQIYHWQGIAPGLNMGMRALLVLSCFAMISAELKNPVLKNLLYNKGFRNLYQAMELAFSALPGIMNEFYEHTQSVKRFRRLTRTMLNRSASMLTDFRYSEENRPNIIIVTGGINRGKTTFTTKITDILKSEGIRVSGFVTLGNTNDNHRNSYSIKEINTGTGAELCTIIPQQGQLQYGRFYFNKNTIKMGCEILSNSVKHTPDLIVIDEIGPLEINGKGWAPAIEELVSTSGITQLWVVRERLVKPIMRKWNVGNILLLNINDDKPETAALRVKQLVRKETGNYNLVCEN